LIDAISKAENFSYQPLPQYDDALLKQAIKSLVKKLETKIDQSI
jgi:hypothetical protein